MSNENKTLNKIAGGLHLINAPAEFEENLPKRVDEFIHNERVFAQLDDFLRTPPQNPKILVLTNPLLEQRKSGIGKKTFVSEVCHMIKSKVRINIRWFDAQSVEIFHYHIDEFVKQIKADKFKKNDDSSHLSQLEALFAKIEAEFKWRTLFVIKNLQNWETIKDFVSEMIKSNKCKAILISRSNLKRNPTQMIRFVEFTFRPSFDDCHRYLGSHLKSKINSQQLNQIIEYQSKKFQQIINPVVLEKLAFYISYNYLYTIEGLIKQLYKIDGFQIIYVINFVSIVDSQSFLILLYAKYLYSDLIPIDLVKRLLSKKRLEIQNSVKLLLDLNLAELVDLNTIRISRLILDEVTESSEKRAKLEVKLAETLSTQFKLSESKMKDIYYPSVLSFLSMWKKFSVKPDDQEFNKHFAQLCFDIGEFNFKQKRLEIAMKYTEMGLKRESDQSEKFNYLLGECYFGLENFQKALEYFNSNISRSSDESTKPYFMIGKCHYKCKNFLDAVTSLRKAYERNQKHIECVYLLARSYEMLEAYEVSVKYNLEVLNLLKSSPPGTPNVVDQFSIYTSLGETMSKLKNYKMSLEYYEKAFDIVAKRSDKVGIAWLFVRMGENNLRLENYDQALNDFMTAYEIRLGDGSLFTLLELAEPLNLAGVVQRRKGNSAIALGYFDRAFRLRFKHHHSTANLDLVNSYINLGLANRDLNQFSRSENFFETAYEMKKQMDSLNEDDANKLKVVEEWKRNQLRREMNRLKSGSMKRILMNKEKASLLNGKSLARVYLFCKDDASLFRELIDDESLSEEDCAEFIKWFDSITLVRNV